PSLGLMLSDDSDGDVPLLEKIKKNPNRSNLLVESPKDISMDYSPTTEGLDLGNMEGPFGEQPMVADQKDNERNEIRDEIKSGKDDQILSSLGGKASTAPELTLDTNRLQESIRKASSSGNSKPKSGVPRPILPNNTSQLPSLGQNTSTHEDVSMDVDGDDPLPNPVEFIRNALSDTVISPATPIDTSSWEPIRLGLQSKAGIDWLCQGRLQNATQEFEPPGFKWIRRKDFEIKSLRAVSQLPILRYNYRPSQHAIFSGSERNDQGILDAFTQYLSQNNLLYPNPLKCGIADTGYPESKLCFYPSQPSFAASFLSVPKEPELRQGPIHLLITVLHLGRGKQQVYPSPSLKIRPKYDIFGSVSRLGSPWIQRGLRILNFPDELKAFLKQRPGGAYTLFTMENSNFRTKPLSKIEEKQPIQQTFEQGLGGVLTFTTRGILESHSRFRDILDCVTKSDVWMAYISPLVVGWIYRASFEGPDESDIKLGKLELTPTPPNPWKTDDLARWFDHTSSLSHPEIALKSQEDIDEAILAYAEGALDELTESPPRKPEL
ncbi:16496_t:CDS:2, partial [Acaulospora colombiana]